MSSNAELVKREAALLNISETTSGTFGNTPKTDEVLYQEVVAELSKRTLTSDVDSSAAITTYQGPVTAVRVGALGKVTAISPDELSTTSADDQYVGTAWGAFGVHTLTLLL